ncbi:MAG: helix-turn-helix domain-containing protein [Phycisphaerales bacterium]
MSTLSTPKPATPASSDRLLNTQQAAEILGCSTRMIHRLVASCDLPKVKIGKAARFRLSDVEALMQKGGAS